MRLTDGGGGQDGASGISHIMAFQALHRASPGQPSSGHQATDPCPPINIPLTKPAYASVDVLKLKNNYTETDTVNLKVCGKGKKRPLLLFVCLLLLVAKVNMSMVHTQFEKHSIEKKWIGSTGEQRTGYSEVLYCKMLEEVSTVVDGGNDAQFKIQILNHALDKHPH